MDGEKVRRKDVDRSGIIVVEHAVIGQTVCDSTCKLSKQCQQDISTVLDRW